MAAPPPSAAGDHPATAMRAARKQLKLLAGHDAPSVDLMRAAAAADQRSQ
jgi:hypothetical protein